MAVSHLFSLAGNSVFFIIIFGLSDFQKRGVLIHKESVKVKGKLVNWVVGIVLLTLVFLAFSAYIPDTQTRGLAEALIVSVCVLMICLFLRHGSDEYMYHIIDRDFIVRRTGKNGHVQLLFEVNGRNISHIFEASDLDCELYPVVSSKDFSEHFTLSKKYVLLLSRPEGLERLTISPSLKTLELLIGISKGQVHFKLPDPPHGL